MRNKEGFVLGLVFFFAAVRYKKIDQANIQIQFLLFFYSFFFPIAEVTLKVKETSQRDK